MTPHNLRGLLDLSKQEQRVDLYQDVQKVSKSANEFDGKLLENAMKIRKKTRDLKTYNDYHHTNILESDQS